MSENKEQQEYFDDLSQHIGRYIRALVDNPNSGSNVKQGDIGKIISDCRAEFPNRKSYSVAYWIRKCLKNGTFSTLPNNGHKNLWRKLSELKFLFS